MFLVCKDDQFVGGVLQSDGFFLVCWDVMDELEGVWLGLVVFWQVGGYLDWVVEYYIQGQLVCQCGFYLGCIVFVWDQVENVGCEVYWVGQYVCESQYGYVFWWVWGLFLGIVFLVVGFFVGNCVGIGVVNVGIFDWFVCID